jgi:hypothetical protein
MTMAVSKTTSGSGLRAAFVVAGAASAGAGLVHGAAAGSHADGGILVWLFAACAAAQLGWAAAVVLIPSRPVLFLGLGINGAAVVTWFLTRTVGLPVVDALAEVEAVGTADLVAGVLGSVAVAATLLAITQPIARRSMPTTWSALVIVGTVALVMPAMAADHSHGGHDHSATAVHAGSAAHAHGDEEGDDAHGHSDAAAAGSDAHAHDDATESTDHGHAATAGSTPTDGHGHEHSTSLVSTEPTPSHEDHPHGGIPGLPPAGSDHPHEPQAPNAPPHTDHPPVTPTGPNPPTQPPHSHNPPSTPGPTPTPTGPIISIDDPRLSAAQRDAAGNLLYRSVSAMAAFPDVAAVLAAGYRSIGDASTGFEHFVNWTYFNDGIELDPQRIESIVIRIEPNGAKTVASAMYILNLGKSLADVPNIAGELTSWHDHKNLCWVPNGEGGNRLSGVTDANGNCAVGANVVTPPMLHVWLTPQPCGPFSGIEGTHGSACGHAH